MDPTEANLINNVDVIEEERRSVLLLHCGSSQSLALPLAAQKSVGFLYGAWDR